MPPTLFESVCIVVPTLTASQLHVLEALLFAPNHSASASQLQTILGLAAVVQVNGAIGGVGRKVYDVLRAHPGGLLEGEYGWWHILATGRQTKDRGFIWTLRQDVVRGLIACGFSSNGHPTPNEVSEPDRLIEGAVRQVTVNAYERNPVARARCIEAHGAACFVCELDFGATYGESAVGYIHVHHLRALASIGEQYEVDPVEDLRPVCPNCHAVIHMADPPHSIEQVKAMLGFSRRDA